MKKVLTLIFSLSIFVLLLTAAGCKKTEEPKKAVTPPAVTSAPGYEPEQKPVKTPAPAPEQKPAKEPAPEKEKTDMPAVKQKPVEAPAEKSATKQKPGETVVAKQKPVEAPPPAAPPLPEDIGVAPLFALNDISNVKVSLSDYRGNIVLLEFTATWCPPCKKAAAELQAVHEKYKGRGVVVLAIFIDKGADAASRISLFMKQFGLTHSALIGDESVANSYVGVSIPKFFIIDREGNIRGRYISGFVDRAVLTKDIEPLL